MKKALFSLLVGMIALAVIPVAEAAANAEKAKPRKEILKKFGLTEDPGTDPDPERVFTRKDGEYTIIKIPKVDVREASNGQDGWVRFRHMQMIDLEVYQENEDYVWVWFWKQDTNVPEIRYAVNDTGQQVRIRELPPEVIDAYREFRKEFEEVSPRPVDTTVRFRFSSKGLPTAGSWRNAPATGDMNGDGFVDIVLPPQRGAATTPTIFLGDGKGEWRAWETTFPFATNYGSVSVGDLNGDGVLDIAQAVHLRGPVVYLGDGKGNFSDASEGLPADYPSRRARLADLDADGDLDLLVISEGPVRGGPGLQNEAKILAFVNDGSGASWTPVDVGDPMRTLGGDWMDAADVNHDGFPDIVGSSVYHGGRTLVQLSDGPASWSAFGEGFFPGNSYYFSLTTGEFDGKRGPDAVMAFQRHWRYEVDPELVPAPKKGRLSGIELVSWGADGAVSRTPIVQWLGTAQGLRAMGAGDFDGDGHQDIAFVDSDLMELVILLGSGQGEFSRATVEGVTLPFNETYDIHVDDLDGDGRDDIILLFEANEMKKDGSVRVWLNRGTGSDG